MDAGVRLVGAVDIDPDAAETYRKNFPHVTFFEKDVADLSVEEVRQLLPEKGPILFAGCAPCQPFSAQQRHSDASDPRRSLLLRFLQFVEALLPDFLLVENVPGLQTVPEGEGPLPTFLESIEALGYQVSVDVLRAADFGVPQIRRRLIIIAARGVAVRLPDATHGIDLLPYSTVRDWISDLPPITAGAQHPEDNDHVSAQLSALNLQRIKATPEGGDRRDWPEVLWANCHREYKGHSDAYGRLAWDRPASGLTTRCVSYSNGRFGHPTQDRAISIREAALLQTFPQGYEFSGSLTSKARQIGNAVPPLMARVLGEQIISLHEESVGNSAFQREWNL